MQIWDRLLTYKIKKRVEKMIKVSDYIFNFLSSNSVNDVFMLPGGGCMYLCDSLGRSELKYTCCLNEQAVTIAALAYAQYKNDIGVALVTSGPGGTNAITGVAAAWTESVPLLVISGQVKEVDMASHVGVRTRGMQELPIADIVKPITKLSKTLLDANDIKRCLEEALYIAKSGRQGPVWLDIPLNVQSALVDENKLEGFVAPEESSESNLQDIAKTTMEMISKSKRPVILAGYGIRAADAIPQFKSLIESLGVPVLTTWKAIDILSEDNPLYVGRPGTAGQRAANFIQQNSDLILTIGARLDFPQIGYDQTIFAREAKKIIVDIDPNELKKFNFEIDLPICADAGDFIEALSAETVSPKQYDEWLLQCKSWNHKYGRVLPEHRNKKDFVSIYTLAEAISNFATNDDLIVPGSSGMGSDVVYQVIKIKDGQRMFNSPGIGSMGFGIPSTLGACIASGGKRTICTNGDGGFQMNIQELETIKSLNLPIKFFVLNNDGYASIRNTQRTYFDGFYVASNSESGVSLPDICKIGKAYGYSVFSIKDESHMQSTLEEIFACDGPVICEVMMDPNEALSFKASSFLLPDGTAITAPLEDLYPFLPRKEFYGNMLIKPINKTGVNLTDILFDLDGTLINSSNGIFNSMKIALESLGHTAIRKEEIENAIGLPLIPMIEKILPESNEREVNEIAKSYRADYSEKGLYDCTLYDGVLELLQTLSKEYNLHIVTSKPLQLAEAVAKKIDIHKYFNTFKGPSLDFAPKTKAELISELLTEKSINVQNCVMIGDRSEDVVAAEINNIKSIGVSYGFGTSKELEKALFVVSSSEELMKCLF